MKKILIFSSAAMLLGAASCSQEEIQAPVENGGNVNLTVALPGAPGTRAFADGLTADNLEMAVYDAETGNLVQTPAAVSFGNSLSTKVSLNLANGRAYKIAFFAHKAGGAYTFSADEANIKVDYTKMNADYNTDNYDCFYKLYETEVISGAISETITLTRPVAQVNWGTSDLEHPGVVAADAYGANAAKLVTKVSAKAFTEFSLLDSDVVEGTDEEVVLAYLERPASSEDFPVDADTYSYLSMQYLLMPAEGTVVDLKLEAANDAAGEAMSTVNVTNAPLQANYRTNVFGALLTSPADFNITKDENFSGANNFGPAPSEVADASALKNILENSTADAEITITDDMDPNEIIEVPASETPREINIDKNGKELPKIIAGEGVVINIYDSSVAGETASARAKRARKATRGGNPANGEPTIWAKEGSIVNIYAGTFQAGVDANGDSNSTIYTDGGVVNIYGGYFSVQKAYNGKYFVLNVKNGSNGVINVVGGSFENQDPSKGDDAGTPASFLATGSKVFAETSGSNTIYRTYAVPTTAAAFAKALANGGDIMVEGDIDLSSILSDPSKTIDITRATNLVVNGSYKVDNGGQIFVKAPLTLSGTGHIDGGIRGTIWVHEGGTLNASGVTFNTPKGYRGGDIWNEMGGDMTITGCTFNSNMASVYFMPAGAKDKVIIKDCIVNNTSRNSIINPETGAKAWSYALRIQGGIGELRDNHVTAIQGAVAVGRNAVTDIYSGTYEAHHSEAGNDGHYAVYTATNGCANIYGGNFYSPRYAVYNGNEDTTTIFGFANIYGGKFSQKAYDQKKKDYMDLPEGYVYKAIEGDDMYKWEVVKE